MVSGKVRIKDTAGLHLTPAGKICSEAIKYKSKITLHYDNVHANAKSIISILSACVKCNNEVEFVCEGEDEEEALTNIMQLIKEEII